MKPNSERVEGILHQSGIISTTSYPKAVATPRTYHRQSNRTYSFEISSAAQKRYPPAQQLPHTSNHLGEGTLFPTTVSLELPAPQSASKEPTLPKLNSRVSSRRNTSNAAFKMHLLPEPQTDIATRQAELQQLLHQIQDIYYEGPMIDGWLESHPHAPEQEESPRAGYRLCGWDATGQKWTRPCPVEQLASVSLAIARYQKLLLLLKRKQYLETRLSQQEKQGEPGKLFLS